ncbi:Hypothetical_protein [Hexamita inflata]|uniref:Hypothetical_protein n=1 Tax=Hexamita inflata TaxID=28002 RepID=A0AA86QNT6_9EUKA|nr:Hypothetical protein HINF_LOCUS49579 [Hexamita inflata]CAI9961935.1 Hypothetical protein HINF_LOCUS49580 [Hexamita inflata]
MCKKSNYFVTLPKNCVLSCSLAQQLAKTTKMQQKYLQYFNLSQNDTKEASNKIEILNSQTIQLGLIVKNLQNELKERKCGEENEQLMGQVIIEQDIVIKEMMAENQQLKFKLGQKDLQDVVK